MDTVSFFIRASLWGAALILLAWSVFVEAGVLNFSLTFLVALLAWGYDRIDKAAFGDLVGHEREPESTVEEVERDAYLNRAVLETHYHHDTPDAVARALEDLRKNHTHARLHYGNVDTGFAERSVDGYVNRSSGALQIPLLGQHPQRGGIPIDDHRIVQIVDLENDEVLYLHPSYHVFQEEVLEEVEEEMEPVEAAAS